MKKFAKILAYYTRGGFYLFGYHIPYKILLLLPIKHRDIVETIRIRDVSYKLNLHIDDGGLPVDLYIHKIREYPNVLYFKDYVQALAPGLKSYIDIGANIGYYAILARNTLRNAKSKASVYGLEPVKDTYDFFRENVRLNRAEDIKTLHVGIGDKDVVAQMIVMRQKNLSKIEDGTIVPVGEVEKTEKIPLYTLRTLFAKLRIPPRDVILRCDIEGYEYNLIVGNIDFLRTLTNAHIIMEFHPFYLYAKKSVKLLETLKGAGYKLDQVVSCEVLYFLKMPRFIRNFLIKLFLYQYDGDALGKIERYRTIDDLIKDIKNEHHALYVYPNLHFYFSKL